MKCAILFYTLLVTKITSSVTGSQKSSRELEGYSSGYLSECPGVNKPVKIPKKVLNSISFTVQSPTNISRRVRYTYHHMKELARSPDVDLSRPTVLYVSGYLVDHPGFPISMNTGLHYKDLGYNFIILEMVQFTTHFYPKTARYMKSIGRHVAEMITELVKEGLSVNTLELVGVSLGAQTMSFIANGYKNITGNNLPLLIGLDPAGPCFRRADPEDRLDTTDADFVIAVHTNIDGFGMAAQMGHIDFYVNGGEFQSNDIIWWGSCDLLCSHLRSLAIWLVALKKPDSFVALQCDSIQQARERNCFDRQPLVTNTLGPHTDRTKQGIFYLSSGNAYPYYLGKKGLKKENDYFSNLLNVSAADTYDYSD